jgi:hypothetical protein
VRQVRHGRINLVAILTLALGLQACDSANVIGPANQLEVTNAVDNFQWQVTALENVTQTLTYSWQNTGTAADVNQSATLSSGTATLRVADSAGAEVYSRSLTDNGTFTSGAGSSGTWTITVTLTGAAGTLNFRVQKP